MKTSRSIEALSSSIEWVNRNPYSWKLLSNRRSGPVKGIRQANQGGDLENVPIPRTTKRRIQSKGSFSNKPFHTRNVGIYVVCRRPL